MVPEHKFATAAKLCGEVLGGVADGLLPLQECEEVLGDALRCLACKDIKVPQSLSLHTSYFMLTFALSRERHFVMSLHTCLCTFLMHVSACIHLTCG